MSTRGTPQQKQMPAFRLHRPAWCILPLRLRTVKGRKLSPLAVLVSAEYAVQRNGSGAAKRIGAGHVLI